MHAECLRHILRARWSTKRINFAFLNCPSCQADIGGIEHVRVLNNDLNALKIFRKNVIKEALKQCEYDDKETSSAKSYSSQHSSCKTMTQEQVSALEKTMFY